jgi:hypothetical protein
MALDPAVHFISLIINKLDSVTSGNFLLHQREGYADRYTGCGNNCQKFDGCMMTVPLEQREKVSSSR